MTLYSYVAPFNNGFQGNPYVSISSIDESGGITCSRTTGKTPCFVQVSASAILCVGGIPYEDLYFKWDFGDSSGTETFTNPGVGGGTVNANDEQYGPEAAYVYRTAGTKTVTLTIYGANASGLIKKTVTQQITVSAFTGTEYWLDSVGGSDANNGLSEGAAKQTLSAALTLIASGTPWLHVKKGSTFTGTASLTSNVASGRIDAYGTGDKPVFNIDDGAAAAFRLTNGGSGSPSAKDDWVMSGLRFTNSDTATGFVVHINGDSNATATLRNIYFDNCESHVGADNEDGYSYYFSGNDVENTGTWNCTATSDQVRTQNTMGHLTLTTAWYFNVGGSISGGTPVSGAVFDHHSYPATRYHSLHRWITFGEGTNRNYCLNMNWDHKGVSLPEIAEYHLIADCGATGVQRFLDLGENNNDPTETLFRNVVEERNRVDSLTADGVILFSCADTFTSRYGEIWGCTGGRYYIPWSGMTSSGFYGHKIHHDATVNANDIISLPAHTGVHTVKGNIVVDLRTSARICAMNFSSASVVDENQYYAPNDANAKFLRDNTTDKSFAEWQSQGYDLNGTVADPGWTDPANGDFS